MGPVVSGIMSLPNSHGRYQEQWLAYLGGTHGCIIAEKNVDAALYFACTHGVLQIHTVPV